MKILDDSRSKVKTETNKHIDLYRQTKWLWEQQRPKQACKTCEWSESEQLKENNGKTETRQDQGLI